MSENINIDANNLCITEEVFEKFQAESMYEEEELITLSDILPSNGTAAPSAPDDVNDFLADDDVQVSNIQIVNSGTETATANVQHSEITTGPGADLGDQEQVLLETSDLNVSENVEVHTESVEQKQPRRRGRQKNKPVQESSENVITEQIAQSRPKRRARKKAPFDDSGNDLSIEEQMKLIHQDNPTEEQQVLEENTEAQIPKRRGGRRKKTMQEPNVNTSIEGKIEYEGEGEQEGIEINSQFGQDNSAPPRRRGRKKKTLQNSSIDTSLENSNLNNSNENLEISENKVDVNDDLPISHMQNKTISENYVDENPNSESTKLTKIRSRRSSNRAINYNETDYEKPLNASPGKRRGRPKKQRQPLSKPDLSQTIENKNNSDSSSSKIGDLSDIVKVEEPSSTVDKPGEEISQEKKCTSNSEIDNDDEGDDICLSNLKRVLVSQDNGEASANLTEDVISSTNDMELEQSKNDVSSNKRNSKAPVHPDFEYNLDNIANEDADKAKENTSAETKNSDDVEDLLVEESGGRPKRRKTKQNFRYQEDSDEDPFANVELSDDDEPKRGKRGTKYYSDDEYIPGRGKKRGKSYTTDSSQSSDMEEIDEGLDGVAKQKRKRFSKKMDSPKKKGSLDVTTIPPASTNTDDIEVCLESSVIKNPQIDDSADNKSNTWGHTNEFESFIAQKIQGTDLKIKKVSSTASTATIAPLDIPSIDPNAKKLVEKSTQTLTIPKNAQGVQTSPPYDIPMKDNVPLSTEQSEKACEFLNSIVKTTSELGVLMTQKSEDFMKKKIHTAHVTDTFKMDYCVRKSFLLFKLAKHNLMQMEEDLAKQYEEFLKANNLHTHREQIKTVASTSGQKGEDNDSDCEIVDVKPIASSSSKSAVTVKKSDKPKFNPKTVFLNKELSIKIAKKTPDDKKLNIKGRHSVWINDSVILKKVTPSQSFLAQDSRNKKPPDSSKIIEKIVCDFFREYDRQKTMSVCAPFISTEWITIRRNYACNYFVASPEIPTGSDHYENSPDPETVSEDKTICESKCLPLENLISPKSLFSLCTLRIQKQSFSKRFTNAEKRKTQEKTPQALFALCLHSLNNSNSSPMPPKAQNFTNSQSLRTICFKKVIELFNVTTTQNLTHFITDKKIIYTEETKQIMPKILHSDREIGESPVKNEVKKLFSICVKFMQDNQKMIIQDDTSTKEYFQDEEILSDVDTSSIKYDTQDCQKIVTEDDMSSVSDVYDYDIIDTHDIHGNNFLPKSLKNITYNKIVEIMYKSCDSDRHSKEHSKLTICEVKKLSKICLDIIKANLYGINAMKSIDMTINSVNTLSEEAFLNIEDTCTVESNQYQYFDEDTNQYEDEFGPEYDFDDNTDDTANQDSNWETQVQMKEFKTCLVSNMTTATEEPITNQVPESPVDTPSSNPDVPFMVNIKSEPLEEELVPQDNLIDPANVKTEPSQVYNEFTISLEHVTTKAEHDNSSAPKKKDGFDGDTFEAFVNSNKMMRAADENFGSEEIFSQSALRVRRQFDPDSDDENDAGMSLLVPHTYEPLQINEAKDTLMQSSSDEGSKDPSSKKKIDKRKKRGRKAETKTYNKEVNVAPKNKANRTETVNNEVNKEVNNALTKNKNNRTETVNNEVAMLTRRMRERIRHEEKKVQSSDSETETIDARSKSDKKKGKTEELPNTSQKSQKTNYNDKDIQCNNVDSTEQDFIDDKTAKQKESVPDEMFTGFTAVDQNEITTYQKYLKDVYDKILPKIVEQCDKHGESTDKGLIMNADEPVEYLECEPTLPIFDKEPRKRTTRRTVKAKAVAEQVVSDKQVPETVVPDQVEPETVAPKKLMPESQPLKEKPVEEDAPVTQLTEVIVRHGWQCYPIDVNDKKLYDDCQILLDKLPETFVEMYFQYQDITERSKEDEEVDRLTNLQSLHGRTSNVKVVKSKTRVSKDKTEQAPSGIKVEKDSDGSRPGSPGSDHYNELTPSEDEGSDHEEEVPLLVAKPSSENHIAKNSLMDDNSDSDTENAEGKLKKIKEEPTDEALTEPKADAPKRKPGPKSKTRPLEQKPVVPPKPAEHSDLMLTADKMMNKELNMLHAPINLDEKVPEVPAKKATTKGKQKKDPSKKQIHYRIKNEDDSSSEEEKQWVTTKEKLLKRLEKKQETTIADEAKRTKIVSEYIERRGENPEPRLTGRRRGRRSNKRFLERQKQLRVLTRELLGDAADSPHHAKRYNQAFFKGRRNIRKVIDKKSLARSTVMANMEEFERKRRLNMKQAKLREILGCEEGVNVLVINDELCLEYDFEQQQPVVSVHPFFTKIMKAHQYEGVKFMWDACFESLSQLATGHPGGGCILAHCMGLGKTLQVLALLHTVLTHPGVGMQRVLVCCPLSTVLNWVDEIHKWIGPVTDQIKVFELSKLKKTYERAYQLEDWYSGGGIFIIGYELFRSLTTLDPYLDDIRPTIVKKIRTALLDPGPDIIVCDEGHLLKNDCSVLAVAMSRVVTKRRIVLTGTPMQNNLREYYCMVNFVKPNLLGTYSEYSNRFENPIMNGQHRDSSAEDIKLMKARTHILHKVLEGCLQRQEASVLYPYLPKKHEYTVFISLTKCQWDMYKYYLTHYANKAKHGVLKDFHMLQKVWSHPQVLHHFQTKARDANTNKVKTEKIEDDLAEEEATTEDIKPPDTDIWWLQFLEGGAMLDCLESSNKFVVVFRILNECIELGDKVLIFSTSLFTMDALEFFLRKINKWSLGQEYYRLDGSVPAEVRQKWCREFNAEHNLKTKLFLISTRAGSLGLNMVAANRVIILDTSWNPAHDIQSIFRVYRFGQKKDCYIYRLVALGTMEQKIYERSVTKQAVACRVVDEQQIDRHYNMQELTELYRFDESGSGVASGVAPGVRDVALLRVARLRALHAVHEHDSLLRGSEPALPEHERQAAWSQFQQEHENGQLQSNEKIKKITAPKRAYNKAVSSTALKPEPGAPDDAQDFRPGPKPKRGRKSANNFEGESILPDPDTERINTLDPGTEQSMVKRITEILVRHNFSYKDAESALPQLVLNVRRIVMSGQSMARCDKLTAEIAAVLMQRQNNMSMPLMNGIIGESLNQTMMDGQQIPHPSTPAYDLPIKVEQPPLLIPIRSAPPPMPARGRPRKAKAGPKCRKGYVYEEIPSTSTAPDHLPLFDRLLLPTQANMNNDGSRMKRKAALAAEKLLDTAVEDGVIDLDNDADYSSSTDSAPETKKNQPTDDKTPPKTKNKVTKPDVTITEKPQTITEKPQPSTSEPKATKGPKGRKSKEAAKQANESELEVLEDVMDTSILLSDDDDSSLVQTAVELEPEGEISVHPSLLKNSNFIKIVAHTYLAGNPMLDEDAAMLAARYSTYKAIKELETTGKPITSGPIYDIAVQVLGKPILKKLHNTSHKMDTAEDDSQSSMLLNLLSGNSGDKDQPPTTEKAKAPEKPSKAAEKPSKTAEKPSKAAEKQAKAAEKGKAEKTTKAPEPPEPVKPEKTQRPKRGRGRKIYVESDDDSDTPIVADDVPLAQVRNNTPPPQPSQRTRRGRQKEAEVATPEPTPSPAPPAQPVPTSMYSATGPMPTQMYSTSGPVPTQMYSASGPVPTQMYITSGPTPTQMYSASGPTPTQMYSATGPTPTQMYSAAGPTPTQMYSATGPTPTQMYAGPGPTPTQMYPGPAPTQMYPAPTATQRYSAPAQQQGVVPVGLFKTTVSVALPGEAQSAQREADECILPDDDDIRIVSDAPAPPAPHAQPLAAMPHAGPAAQAPSVVPISKLVAQPGPTGPKRNTKPIILKMVRSAANSQMVEMVASPQPPRAAGPQYRLVGSEAQQPQQMPVPAPAAPQVSGSTICLDSDDEDAPLAPPPAAQPAPYPTAISMATSAYNPTLNYAPIAPKPTTAAPPVKLKLTKVDPSKFVLTTKKQTTPAPTVQAPSPSGNTGNDPPVRYIVIPKSQVAQMYPPLVPVSAEQIVPNQVIQANADGSYTFQTMNAPTISVPSTSNVFTHTGQTQANLNVLTHAQTIRPIPTPSATVGPGRKVAQNEPKILNATLSAPTVSIDSGRILRQSSEEIVPTPTKKSTPVKPVERPPPAAPAASSSDSDDSSDNDDPLSILRDVVHIQAEPEAAPPPAKPKSQSNNQTIVTTHKPDPKTSNSTPAKTPAASTSNKVPAKTRVFLDSVDLTFNDDESEKELSPPATKTKPAASKPQPAASKPQPAASKPQPAASKPPSLASKTQLTVTKMGATKTQPAASKAQPAKTAQPATKISQTTSKTLQSSASKTAQSGSKWQPGASKTFTTTASKTAQPATSNKNNSSNQTAAKKRTAPVETPAPKKKKTDQLMTLKDFNLDDIDDIIELD